MNKEQETQKVENLEDVLDLNTVIQFFNPYLIIAFGSSVTGIRVNNSKMHQDIDLLIIIEDNKDCTNFKKNEILNRLCNLSGKYLDVIWLLKTAYDELVSNSDLKRLLGETRVLYRCD